MDVIGVKLRGALSSRGCPVCRLMEKFEEDEIVTVLYEHVTDPEVRVEFRKSLGLCTRHAWKVLETALKNPLLGPLGVSIIYEDVLEAYLKGNGEENDCFLCKLLEEKERTLIGALAERLEELLPEYSSSPSILCRRHYSMLLQELGERTELAERLSEIQAEKLRDLDSRLRAFIKSYDYRSRRSPGEEEVRALEETIEFLKGRPLVSGLRERKRREKRWFLRLK